MISEVLCIRYDGLQSGQSSAQVAAEEPLSIFINGRHYTTAMISPSLEREFVTGHLLSEGIIKSYEELLSLDIEGSVARAMVKSPARIITSRRPIVSGCGGASSFLDAARLERLQSTMTVSPEDIYSSMQSASVSKLHESTGGLHCVGLFSAGHKQPPLIAEDIGRHNALDKVIGLGLKGSISFGDAFAVSTGRISSEMALKCCAAGIALIASRGATTSLAVEIAQRTGLALIGFVRGKRMNVYAGWERITTI